MDGGANQIVTLLVIGNWDIWFVVFVAVPLAVGDYIVMLARVMMDSGNVNVDSVVLITFGAVYFDALISAIPDCWFDMSCEVEFGRAFGMVQVVIDYFGFVGPGFVAELNQGFGLIERIADVFVDGTYTLIFRYANGIGGDGLHQTRIVIISVGGT